MSEASLRLVVEFVGGIFLVYITHYLTRSHYERKRQDELADRVSAKLLQEKDKKLAQAQEYLNVCTEAARIMILAQITALTHRNADVVKADAQKVLPLMNLPPNILMSVQLLNSPELAEVANQFRVLIYDEHQKMFELLLALHAKKPINESEINSRILEFVNKSGQYSGRIQVMLDKLASKLK